MILNIRISPLHQQNFGYDKILFLLKFFNEVFVF